MALRSDRLTSDISSSLRDVSRFRYHADASCHYYEAGDGGCECSFPAEWELQIQSP